MSLLYLVSPCGCTARRRVWLKFFFSPTYTHWDQFCVRCLAQGHMPEGANPMVNSLYHLLYIQRTYLFLVPVIQIRSCWSAVSARVRPEVVLRGHSIALLYLAAYCIDALHRLKFDLIDWNTGMKPGKLLGVIGCGQQTSFVIFYQLVLINRSLLI